MPPYPSLADPRCEEVILGALHRQLKPPPEPVTEIVYVSEVEAGSPHLGDRDFIKAWMKEPRP